MRWEEGEVKPSLKDQIINTMEEDPNKLWDAPQLRGELFPDVEMPDITDMTDFHPDMAGIIQTNSQISAILEILVAEGRIEKREFRVDTISMITINEKEYEQIAEDLSGNPMTDKIFYKATD